MLGRTSREILTTGLLAVAFVAGILCRVAAACDWQPGYWFPGLDGVVETTARIGSTIYIGGSFTHVDGVSVNHVAMWDGTSWQALGTGMNSTVDALAVDSSGNLYAGGNFTTAGGGAANRVAKWNGTSWTALGTGTNGIVAALIFDSGGTLIAGGFFTAAGGVSTTAVAQWNGASWAALGTQQQRRARARQPQEPVTQRPQLPGRVVRREPGEPTRPLRVAGCEANMPRSRPHVRLRPGVRSLSVPGGRLSQCCGRESPRLYSERSVQRQRAPTRAAPHPYLRAAERCGCGPRGARQCPGAFA